jgi:hypothetical protein
MNLTQEKEPEWYQQFETELKTIVELVKNENDYKTWNRDTDKMKYPILTGSAAIAFVLKYLGMYEELEKLEVNNVKPNDLDFLYFSDSDTINPDTIGEFRINPKQKLEKSVTFELKPHNPSKYYQKF